MKKNVMNSTTEQKVGRYITLGITQGECRSIKHFKNLKSTKIEKPMEFA